MQANRSLSTYTNNDLSTHPLIEKFSNSLISANQTIRLSLGWMFELGIRPGMPIYQKRNLALINQVAFAGLLTAFPGTFLLILLGFKHPLSIMISAVLLSSLVLGLNGARHAEWSTTLFAFSPAGMILLFSLLELGAGGAGNSLVQLLFRQGMCFALLLPTLFFGLESQRKGWRVTGIGVLLYLVYEVGGARMGTFGGQNFSGFTHGLFSLLTILQYLALAGCVLYMQNSTRQQELQAERNGQKMQRLAIRDGMTGLYNHAFMEEMIGDAIQRSRRSHTPLSLLMIDVDHFKHVNDTYGHNAGDETLKEVIQLLKEHKRSTDYLGRWGGDELVMLLTDTNLAGASNLAEKLRGIVADHAFPHCIHLTISLGASQYQENEAPLAIVERADAAMYRAKRAGRNRSGV